MEERILLSSEEAIMLKEPETFLDSTRRNRIIKKVVKCISTLDYVAGHDKIPFDKLWQDQITQIKSFLTKLIEHDSTNIPIEESGKLTIASELINIGLDYYSNAFKNSKFFEVKIKEVKDLITAINEINQKDKTDKNYSLLYTMRKKNPYPPNLKDIGGANDYVSYCVLCFKWATGKDKKQSMKKIRHHAHCYYDRKYPEFTMVTREPKIELSNKNP